LRIRFVVAGVFDFDLAGLVAKTLTDDPVAGRPG
jgi:hypothetical protein